jgi:hypothetical protein
MLLFTSVHKPKEWLYGHDFYKTAQTLYNEGFQFDYISSNQLGKLNPSQHPYKTLIIPKIDYLSLEDKKQITKLSENGLKVILKKTPKSTPGLNSIVKYNPLDFKGKIIISEEILSHLNELKKETIQDLGLSFIRKKYKKDYVYFIANFDTIFETGYISLSPKFKNAEIINPLSGKKGLAKTNNDSIYLELPSGSSVIIRLSKKKIKTETLKYNNVLEDTIGFIKPCIISFPNGEPPILKHYTLDSIVPWTSLDDSTANLFCGTGQYNIRFLLKNEDKNDLILDLGDVRETARIFINGNYIGELWCHPYRISIPKEFLLTKNILTIDVKNLAFNKIKKMDRDEIYWKKFKNINFVDIQYNEFDASNMPIAPSGIIGPLLLYKTTRQ